MKTIFSDLNYVPHYEFSWFSGMGGRGGGGGGGEACMTPNVILTEK